MNNKKKSYVKPRIEIVDLKEKYQFMVEPNYRKATPAVNATDVPTKDPEGSCWGIWSEGRRE